MIVAIATDLCLQIQRLGVRCALVVLQVVAVFVAADLRHDIGSFDGLPCGSTDCAARTVFTSPAAGLFSPINVLLWLVHP